MLNNLDKYPDLREFGNTTIEKVQNIQFRLLCIFNDICHQNNLVYWLDGGTLLGARRHKGFIPWDDDIDITMPRKDYNIFIKVAQEYFPDDCYIELSNRFMHKKDYYVPCKIVDKYSEIVECSVGNDNEIGSGISLDIFPMDVYSSNGKIFFIQKKIKKIFKKICLFKQNKKNIMIDLIAFFYFKILGFFVVKNITPSSIFGLGYDVFFERFHVYNDIFPLKKQYFKNMEFNVPNNTDKVLEMIYGESFLVLPPVEKRVVHIYSVIIDNRFKRNVEKIL